jgi:hypothetical protein
MEYIFISVVVVLLALSFNFKRKYRRLLNTGRIPDVIAADHRANFFLALAVITIVVFLVFRQNS